MKKIDKEEIWLDRKVEVNGQGVEKIPYAYLVSIRRCGSLNDHRLIVMHRLLLRGQN